MLVIYCVIVILGGYNQQFGGGGGGYEQGWNQGMDALYTIQITHLFEKLFIVSFLSFKKSEILN